VWSVYCSVKVRLNVHKMGMLLKSNRITALMLMVTGFLAVLASSAETAEENSAPVLTPVARQYVVEGELLSLDITAHDADGDQISLWVSSRPNGAEFVDHGDGTAHFEWQPDFSGPNSSEGSPFALSFGASDGTDASTISTDIVVINKNRKPVIIAADTVPGQAGDHIVFNIHGEDPDHDPISWTVLELPGGAEFDLDDGVRVDWTTAFADSGYHYAKVELTDQYGAADTARIVVALAQTIVFALTVDTASGYPGELATVNVLLNNLEEIAGFDLLINYDYTALGFGNATTAGTRSEHFEYFSYRLAERGIEGDVRLIGIADTDDGIPGQNLPVGDGPIVELKFYISSGTAFAGFAIPVTFVFRDVIFRTDNVLTAIDGSEIGQDIIHYFNGYVSVLKSPLHSLGDINLNGIPFEIADVIYFTNYFINPALYPLSPQQRANSDVNQDGYGATIADLVFMINHIVNFGASPKPVAGYSEVAMGYMPNDSGYVLAANSAMDLGGFALTLELIEGDAADIHFHSELADCDMTVKSGREGSLLRLLVYGEEGQQIPAGTNHFLIVDNSVTFKIREVQFSSAYGTMLGSVFKEDLAELVPHGFELHQNHPNPFNPATEISFELPRTSRVTLAVYNLLGQEIATLIDRELQAGRHAVIWNGRDESGRKVSSGVYLYRIQADEFSKSKKMILLK
ncbi:MAG: T9SS type A sorting domain-containing protein, partial [Candidatus Zixiibacteriota bacterium]